MSRNTKIILVVIGSLVLLCLAGMVVWHPARSTGPVEGVVGLANPASVYCQEQGYTLEIRTAEDGSQYGACIFPDRSECEEWAFYRGECGPTAESVEASMSTLALRPGAGSPGQAIQATGAGFVPGASIALRLGAPDTGLSGLNLIVAVADAHGAFDVELTLPAVWPGTETPIVERELVIAAVDEARGQTLAVASFTNTSAESVECFDDCLIFARDTALGYITDRYGARAPVSDLAWEQVSMAESMASEGSLGEVTYEFAADGWTAIISYPIGGSGSVVYTVEVVNQSAGFRWKGTVDTHGNVTE